jgi:hypothetical protein
MHLGTEYEKIGQRSNRGSGKSSDTWLALIPTFSQGEKE